MNWVPLVEYSAKKGVSLSTLRRYIKANKIQYRLEDGRYLVLDHEVIPNHPASHDSNDARVRSLEEKLRLAYEEISELKMLIALYEEQNPHQLDC